MPAASPSPLPATEPTTVAMAASPTDSTSTSSSNEVSSRYRDNDGAGSSLPAAQGIKSTLTKQETVRGICKKFSIPAEYKPSCAGGVGRACKVPPHLKDCICVYEAALDAGMRIPLHPFYSKLLRHYNLAPSQLTPNSWRYMAAFVVLCSDAGLKPRLSVFRHFFTVCLYTHSNRDGWYMYIIRPRMVSDQDRRCRLFSTSSWQLPKNDGWKERFFFLSSPTGTWPCPVKWGKPSGEATRDPKLSVKAIEGIQKLYNMQVSTCIDLMSLLANDKLAAALAQVRPVKKDVDSGVTVAMMGPTTPKVKSAIDIASPVTCTPPGGSITRDQVLVSAVNTDCDEWLRTVLKETADVVIKESSLLRQQLTEARKSEAAAKAKLLKARMSKMAYKADLDNARKSEAAAKSELAAIQAELSAARAETDKARKLEAVAKAELLEARKSEAAAMAKLEKERKSNEAVTAQLSKAKKSEVAPKVEISVTNAKLEEMRKSEAATKAELISTKVELDEIKKSEASTKAKLAAAKVKVQNMGNEYFEDVRRLQNLMMNSFESAFGMVS